MSIDYQMLSNQIYVLEMAVDTLSKNSEPVFIDNLNGVINLLVHLVNEKESFNLNSASEGDNPENGTVLTNYVVTVWETIVYELHVEATNSDDAKELAEELIGMGDDGDKKNMATVNREFTDVKREA